MKKTKVGWEREFDNDFLGEYGEIIDVWDGIEIKKFIRQIIAQELRGLEMEIEEKIEKSRGNDYHNIGIGSLDYHEKCAVDAYIETLRHRLKLNQRLKEVEK